MRTQIFLGVVVGLCLFAVACIHREHRELKTVQREHRACVEARGADHPKCLDLQAKLLDAQERYEDEARRAWNCETSPDECPRRRRD